MGASDNMENRDIKRAMLSQASENKSAVAVLDDINEQVILLNELFKHPVGKQIIDTYESILALKEIAEGKVLKGMKQVESQDGSIVGVIKAPQEVFVLTPKDILRVAEECPEALKVTKGTLKKNASKLFKELDRPTNYVKKGNTTAVVETHDAYVRMMEEIAKWTTE